MHLLGEPAIWQALAPTPSNSKEGSQDAPSWFPGARSQYLAFLRARAGSKVRCTLTMALGEMAMQADKAAEVVVDLASPMVQQELAEARHAEQIQEHGHTRTHISEEMEAFMGARPDSLFGEADKGAASKIKAQRAQLKMKDEMLKMQEAARKNLVEQAKEEDKAKREEDKAKREEEKKNAERLREASKIDR